ncbi:MAG: glycogen debranching enzyme GlgX, partial [Pseudomonadota bacterium]
NASYYRLLADGSYDNVTGTGNALNCDSPPVQHLILASLRYWVTKMGVDGFRFDLAATLGRRADGFSTRAALFDAIRADPVLGEVKLIAEPWDIGPGGYNLGGFPYPFAEWNDVFRDTMRRFWRGDAGQAARLADGLTGSARHFDRGDRPATASVNFVTAHDGFTLHDLTAYAARRNEANGEDGRDGHGENWSDAIGGEGATEDAGVRASRVRRMQNLLATLFVAQGTPMILAGDEVANSQGGNNNTYAQDNSTGWVDWQSGEDLTAYVAALAALRRRLPVLRQTRFLHGTLDGDGTPDVLWWHPEGRPMAERDWIDPENRLVMASLRRATASAMSAMPPAFVVLNAGPAVPAQLPEGNWRGVFASHGEAPVPEDRAIKIPAHIVLVYEAEPNT